MWVPTLHGELADQRENSVSAVAFRARLSYFNDEFNMNTKIPMSPWSELRQVQQT
jgi:hypothetical protein